MTARKGDDDFSTLQVYVYEEEEGNVYEHHDIVLPAFPLCVEWLGVPLKNTPEHNFVAVGTFEPAIEIWDLDTIDCSEPLTSLGGMLVTSDPREEEIASAKKKGKKGKKKKAQKAPDQFLPGSHQSAVLSLSWNRLNEILLASGSADTTVKVWDLSQGTCAHTYTHHSKEVQSAQWHHTEGTLLLTIYTRKLYIGTLKLRSRWRYRKFRFISPSARASHVHPALVRARAPARAVHGPPPGRPRRHGGRDSHSPVSK